ncbi:hypothetical protein D3C87_1821440 [compost metagenome]
MFVQQPRLRVHKLRFIRCISKKGIIKVLTLIEITFCFDEVLFGVDLCGNSGLRQLFIRKEGNAVHTILYILEKLLKVFGTRKRTRHSNNGNF